MPRSGAGGLQWTFVAPSLARPAGGLIALFEIAGAVAQRGDRVQVVHVPTAEAQLHRIHEIPWFRFETAIEHVFATDFDPLGIPSADVIVCTPMLFAAALSPNGGALGRRLVDSLFSDAAPLGAPIAFVQGLDVFPSDVDELVARLPGPKVCVGSQLAETLIARGLPSRRVMHIANGLDHDTFRVRWPIADRRPSIAMHFDPHPVKGGREGLAAIRQVVETSAIPAILFGAREFDAGPIEGIETLIKPSQQTLADRVYNQASIFLQPSRREGFGLCAVEAMACGCALVTTDNGGSADYAIDGTTAIVCGHEPADMADAVRRLLRDDASRQRIAANGVDYVQRFSWPSTAEKFAEIAAAWVAERREP